MIETSVKTFVVKIYMAGDINIIKQACRKYCMKVGFCVTVTATDYIYTGGEEYGVEIGLLNYPRFPKTKKEIIQKAIELATLCRDEAQQHSWLVVTPEKTIWNSTRKQ